MRDFKFRVWDDVNKQMTVFDLTVEGAMLNIAFLEGKLRLIGINSGLVYPIELEQYMRIPDKNRKEIYEGDIVNINVKSLGSYDGPGSMNRNYIGIAWWIPSLGACIKNIRWEDVGKNNRGKRGGYMRIRTYRSEIIGNIHQNPELLEVKK